MFRVHDESVEAIGGYGYKERRQQSRTTHDGLAAECARTGNAINVSPIPADYLRIGSGLGEAAPASIRLWPLPGIARVAGVIELASFRPLDAAGEGPLTAAAQLKGMGTEAPQDRTAGG